MASVQNIEWLNQNMLRSYPVHEDSDTTPRLTDGSVATGLKLPNCLLSDFTFTVPMDVVNDDTVVSLTGLSNVAGTVTLEFSLDDTVLGSVSVSEGDHTVNSSYLVRGTGEYEDCGGWVTVGDLSKAMEELPEGVYRFDAGQVPMEMSTLRMSPSGVRSLSALSRFGGTQYARLRGNVRLIAGEDVELRVDRANNAIWMKAVSGSGYESAETCECESAKRSYVRRINGMAVEDVDIIGSTCVKVSNDTVNNTIELSDSCSQPCCGCAELNFVEGAIDALNKSLDTLSSYENDLSSRLTELNTNLQVTADSLITYPDLPGDDPSEEEWDTTLEPVCITAEEDMAIHLFRGIATFGGVHVQAPAPYLQVSTDKENWTDVDTPPDEDLSKKSVASWTVTRKIVTLKAGESAYFRGRNRSLATCPNDNYGMAVGNRLSPDGKFKVSGNVMSLLGRASMDTSWCLAGLFQRSYVTDASDLILPAYTLTTGCYMRMFYMCTDLKKWPTFGDNGWPILKLADYSCKEMFYGCSSLENLYDLDGNQSRQVAFQIEKAAKYCCYKMYEGCSSLKYCPASMVPETIAPYCYYSMFKGCSSLTNDFTCWENRILMGSEVMADSCYAYMFEDCTSLSYTTAFYPHEPATACCKGMFKGCTGIRSASISIEATVKLPSMCFAEMFYGCSSLSRLTIPFYAWPWEYGGAIDATNNWLYGVAATGDVTARRYVSDVRGPSAIPVGWTISRYVNA